MFLCLEHARLIWIRSANSHTGPQLMLLHHEAGQMAASDLRAITLFTACVRRGVHRRTFGQNSGVD
jgi:hypothetical protein